MDSDVQPVSSSMSNVALVLVEVRKHGGNYSGAGQGTARTHGFGDDGVQESPARNWRDIEAAVESMRKAGQAKADKKASRIAAEGLIVIKQAAGAAAMVEINCETDFVTKNDDFRAFADAVTEVVLSERTGDLGALLASNMVNGQSVEQSRRDCIAKIGENINVRRFARLASPQGVLGCYLHGTRIGVLVELEGGDANLARGHRHACGRQPAAVRRRRSSAGRFDRQGEGNLRGAGSG
jgi:elongation factor Ts